MLYWIIPYLVAYNTSIPSGSRYGTDYVFDAQVTLVFNASDYIPTSHQDYHMKLVCRPLHSDLIQCRIRNAVMDIIELMVTNKTFGLDDIVFLIEYNAKGISWVSFMNTNDSYMHNMIREIIATMNMGISITGKTVGNYSAQEISNIGTCNTSFNIKNERLSDSEILREITIEGHELVVPSLSPLSYHETIVIEKDRYLTECKKKTPYFFGCDTEDGDVDIGRKPEVSVTTSRSRFNIGKESFSASTESSGTIDFAFRNEPDLKGVSHLNQTIRVTLESIHPGKPEDWTIRNLVNTGSAMRWPGKKWGS